MSTIKKLIEIDDAVVTKLKVLSAFENLSVKALIEKAVREFVQKKELERFESLSDDQKEDLGLLLLMQQVDKTDFMSEEEFLKTLDK